MDLELLFDCRAMWSRGTGRALCSVDDDDRVSFRNYPRRVSDAD